MVPVTIINTQMVLGTRGILHNYNVIRPGPVQDIVGEGARTAAWS